MGPKTRYEGTDESNGEHPAIQQIRVVVRGPNDANSPVRPQTGVFLKAGPPVAVG